MNLDQLFKLQQIMENNIKRISQIDENALGEENVFDLRFLALQVKVGELANLTKCYKYSKTREDISRDKLMIRYIDAMKYLLSIGNENNFSIINIDSVNSVAKEESVIKAFGNIFDDITHLKYNIKHSNYIDAMSRYIKLLGEFLNLGSNLGLSFEEVYNYYLEMAPCSGAPRK
ncbi:dUTP diphosphatase [Proteiniborus sp.]|uniref:dUTP diphosphatase n=1 Tax=Proteiniborus sp. TaxID=2079015 RepID=UPI003329CAA5